MNAGEPTVPAHGRIAQQIPTFAAIGLLGYFVDAAITYLGAKYLGLSPELARPPGFILATIVNFALNRSITFRYARSPLTGSFVRYSLVASAGLAVNYAVYSACVFLAPGAGIAVTPGNPAAVCRRRQRCGDGSHLCRLSVLRLSSLRNRQISGPKLANASYDCLVAPWSSAKCPFRPMIATSIAIPPTFSR